MKITVISYSLSSQPKTLASWKEELLGEIQSLVECGTEVILYPELFLMGLSDYFKEDNKEEFKKQLRRIASFIEKELLPDIEKILGNFEVMLVLGSGPRYVDENCFNSAFIFANKKWYFQDKLHLTPWEVDFIPGESVQLINFKSLKVATVICYDVEQPRLALKLKEAQIHLLLVPSATTNRNGNQRVLRCSSSRSIELGAAVVVVPLVGDSLCDLIDHNEGRQGFFMPAQELVQYNQEVFSEYSVLQKQTLHYHVDVQELHTLKALDSETKPYLKEDNPRILIKN